MYLALFYKKMQNYLFKIQVVKLKNAYI